MAPGGNRFLVEQEDVEQVIIADLDLEKARRVAKSLGEKAIAKRADFNDHRSLVELLRDVDAVLNSTVYYSNLKVMRACLEAGTHYVDLGGLFHMAKEQFKLDREFREADLTAISGLGSAPGIVNIMARYAADRLDKIEYIRIRDGIVNFTPTKVPLKVPYALDTLLDEFTVPAQIFEDGKFKEVPPFSGEEEVDYPEPVGRQKSYYTLHTEVYTLPLSFKDKGVREVNFKLALPRELEWKMRFLVDLGFGSKEPIMFGKASLSPREVLNGLLARFTQDEHEQVEPDDHKVLRVDVKGERDGEIIEYRLESIIHPLKRFNLPAGTLSVGGPGAMATWMVARGDIRERGVLPPERCIDPEYFFKIMAEWGMPVYVTEKKLIA
jgi:saccharopine dehydrogenase-like NADP-dependent oxidoreductase